MIILMVTGNEVWNADGWKLMEFFFSLLRKDLKKNMYPGMAIYISATSPVTNPRSYLVRESINTWYNMIYSTCISTARLGLCYNNTRSLYATTSKSFIIYPKKPKHWGVRLATERIFFGSHSRHLLYWASRYDCNYWNIPFLFRLVPPCCPLIFCSVAETKTNLVMLVPYLHTKIDYSR